MMPKNRSKSRGRSRSRGRNNGAGAFAGPRGAQVTYSGPTKLPVQINPPTQVVELHSMANVLLTAAAGQGFVQTSADPQGIPVTEWSSWASLFREYRILSIRMEFHPTFKGGAPPLTGANLVLPFFTTVDRDSTGTPSSYTGLLENTSLRVMSLASDWFRECKMRDTAESQYLSVNSAPVALLTINAWYGVSSGNYTGTFGMMLYRYLVEFRTRV